MGTLPQVLVIFEVQRKMSNEKITREISFPTYKTHYYYFLCTPPTFKPRNFFISYSF
jgi:hypothetical protein